MERMPKPERRTKSVTTKVTEAEYVRLEEKAAAGGLNLSEWVRGLLLASQTKTGTGVVLAEMLALRSILLNLFFRVSQGEPVPAEEMKSIILKAGR
jgi:hypothetical protein